MLRQITITDITSDGYLIGKCSGELEVPERIKALFNTRNEKVAQVIKIFGSVDSPYIKAKPIRTGANVPRLPGGRFYLR